MDTPSEQFFVYEITNEVDGSIYVGETSDPERRWEGHTSFMAHPLYAAMAVHGTGSFSFRVVEEHATRSDAWAGEKSRIKQYVRDGHHLYNTQHAMPEHHPATPTHIPRANSRKTWNGKVYCQNGWIGRYCCTAGVWCSKRIPSCESMEAAQTWFGDWLEAHQAGE